jgi:hypothetical protein
MLGSQCAKKLKAEVGRSGGLQSMRVKEVYHQLRDKAPAEHVASQIRAKLQLGEFAPEDTQREPPLRECGPS